jgi:hypothetical protein
LWMQTGILGCLRFSNLQLMCGTAMRTAYVIVIAHMVV